MVVELPLVLSCMWPLEDRRELLGAIEARNVAPAVQVVQFGGCEVDCLSVARGIVVVLHRGRRRFLEHRQERRVHHAYPAVAHGGG